MVWGFKRQVVPVGIGMPQSVTFGPAGVRGTSTVGEKQRMTSFKNSSIDFKLSSSAYVGERPCGIFSSISVLIRDCITGWRQRVNVAHVRAPEVVSCPADMKFMS